MCGSVVLSPTLRVQAGLSVSVKSTLYLRYITPCQQCVSSDHEAAEMTVIPYTGNGKDADPSNTLHGAEMNSHTLHTFR